MRLEPLSHASTAPGDSRVKAGSISLVRVDAREALALEHMADHGAALVERGSA
jgi:hypothetical protein